MKIYMVDLSNRKVKRLMELMQSRQAPEIDEISPDEEVLRVLLGANNQLGHTYRDIATVYAGLFQLGFSAHNDEEVKKLAAEIQEDLLEVGKKLKAAVNSIQVAFDQRVLELEERKALKDDGKPIGRYA